MMGQSGRLAGRRWGWLVALGGALAVLALQGGRPQAAQAAGCDFQRGFAALRAAIVATAGEDVVGACLESEWHRGNGDAEQATEGGVFFWEKEHNHTWFTDGSQAWSWGPQGLTQQPLAALAADQAPPVAGVVAAGGGRAPQVINGCEITAFTNCPGWDLRGANLRWTNLSHANLTGADLFQANLTGAELLQANLSGANLSGANLFGASLTRASLSDANLSGADLFGAELFQANLSDVNLSGAYLFGARLFQANLSNANLSEADLRSASLFQANLSGARCWRTTWTDRSVRAPDQPGPCE